MSLCVSWAADVLSANGAAFQSERRRQHARRRYATKKQRREALAEITHQVSTDAFVPRKTVTVDDLCADWLASLHNARQNNGQRCACCLAPFREQRGRLAAQKLARQDLDKLLIALRDGGTKTPKGHTDRLALVP